MVLLILSKCIFLFNNHEYIFIHLSVLKQKCTILNWIRFKTRSTPYNEQIKATTKKEDKNDVYEDEREEGEIVSAK